jgi:high-affinity nickel-transport protein
MDRLLPLLAFGFVLGLKHATDADHVVAVSTIVSRERSLRGAAWVGAMWGVGHTVTVGIVGGAIVLLGLVVPPRVGLSLELGVALMLVALGAFNLLGLRRDARAHDGHAHDARSTAAPRRSLAQLARSLFVGVVHGLAGSAAVALLVLASIRDARQGVAYLAVFGAGTIAGMALLTTLVALPVAFASGRFARMQRSLVCAAGAASVAFGLFLFWRIGFVDGLFTAAPHWSP